MPKANNTETPSDETRETGSSSSGRKKVLFRLVAIGLSLLPFVLAEVVLGVFDIGNPQEQAADPFVGFSEVNPLFVLNEDQQSYTTSRSRLSFFNQQEFSRQKPANGIRIFCLGGSTVHGRPYGAETSFAKWLELELNARDPAHEYQVINCGGLSYASYRLRLIHEEVTQYDPDMIIVATGHNEFLEDRTYGSIKDRSKVRSKFSEVVHSSRLVTLARQAFGGAQNEEKDAIEDVTVLQTEVNARLDKSSGYASFHPDEQWRAEVIKHFRFSIEKMIEVSEGSQVPLVLVSLGSNLRDCSPFKSEHLPGMDETKRLQWQKLFDQASDLDESDLDTALELYHRAEAIESREALLNWRLARGYDRKGDFEKAAKYYSLAKQWDACPLRSLDEITTAVHELANEHSITLVDAKKVVEGLASDEIPGNDAFVDHVHPSIGGHQAIAKEISRRLDETKLAPLKISLSMNDRRHLYQTHLDSLGRNYFDSALRRVEWLENWARRTNLLSESAPVTERATLDLGKKKFGFGEEAAAMNFFDLVIYERAESVQLLIDYALELVEQGSVDHARELLDWLVERREARKFWANLTIAQLGVALEMDATDVVDQLVETHSSHWESIDRETHPWLLAIPEIKNYLD